MKNCHKKIKLRYESKTAWQEKKVDKRHLPPLQARGQVLPWTCSCAPAQRCLLEARTLTHL